MLNFIDRFVEKLILRKLHSQRKKYIEGAITAFKKTHPNVSNQDLETLRNNIIVESDRIYDTIDKSIIYAGIERAKWIFWVAVICGTIGSIPLIVLTHGAWLALLTPIYAGIIAWVATIATVHIGYNSRVSGGLDAVVHQFEKLLESREFEKKDTNTKIEEIAAQIGQIATKFYDTLENEENVKTLNKKLKEYITNNNCQQLLNVGEEITKLLTDEKAEKPFIFDGQSVNNSTKILLLNLNHDVKKLNKRVDELYELFEQEKKERLAEKNQVPTLASTAIKKSESYVADIEDSSSRDVGEVIQVFMHRK